MICPDFIAALRDSAKDLEQLPLDNNDLMYDLYNAQSWNNAEIGLKHVFLSNGVPYDTEISPGSRRKFSKFKYGLQVSINLDWYVCWSIFPFFLSSHILNRLIIDLTLPVVYRPD